MVDSPAPTNSNISKTMRSNTRKDTKPELILRRALREAGKGGYRLQWKVPGHPDICYPGRKIAIFVNGCFWHRCPFCNLPLPKSNVEFWKSKFEKNVERDQRKTCELESMDWTVVTVWECELRNNLEEVVARIVQILDNCHQS